MRSTPYDMATRIYNMLSRAILTKKIDDKKLLQEHDIELFAGESRKGVERFQFPFLTSVPHVENDLGNLEEIIACIGGVRTHMVIIAADDRRYRITGLEQGELMIHDEQGQQVHITRKGVNASIPHDLVLDFRIMKKDKGDPLHPMTGIQASKTSMKDDVLATVHFDRKSFTVTHRNKDKYKDEEEYKPQIKHQITDKDDPDKVYSSMVMNMDGITWTTTGKLTWNAPHQEWNADDMTWKSKTELHDAKNSIDTKAIRTTLETKKPNDDEKVSLIETVHPPDEGGVTLIGMEESKKEADAADVVTVQGDAKHVKALPA
jgi:Bacteriophage Mu Gp45 spike protein